MTLPRAYEDQLVERAKEEPEAFGELYDHYVGQMYRFVYSRLRDQAAAEDVTSDVFLKALRAIPRYQSTGKPFSAWLYQIASNAITDFHRARRPTSDLDDAAPVADAAPTPDERVIKSQEMERIWSVIDSLPEAQRVAVTLKFANDLKLAQIGEIMGRSEGAIKLLIHRGMTTLRASLDAPVEEHSS